MNTVENQIKVGDVIEFTCGYYDHLRIRQTVIRIDGEDIYVDWDCYWFPIQNTPVRNIKIMDKTQVTKLGFVS
jgi:hypothetical protein